MIREATAIWKGGPLAGEGKVYTPSGALAGTIFSLGHPLIDGLSTNPCEILAAAQAACIASMVASELSASHMSPIEVDAKTTVKLERDPFWHITSIDIAVSARAEKPDHAMFEQAVRRAEEHCPITQLFKIKPKITAALVEARSGAA
jgi:osmotically inducible protein OsmC